MNDTQIVEQILDELDLKTRDDLVYWIENFSEGYECDHWYGMVSDEGGYRIETEEEKAAQRRRLQEYNERMRERWNAGERSMDMLLWKTMDSYAQMALDNIFSARPLLHQLINEDNDDATT